MYGWDHQVRFLCYCFGSKLTQNLTAKRWMKRCMREILQHLNAICWLFVRLQLINHFLPNSMLLTFFLLYLILLFSFPFISLLRNILPYSEWLVLGNSVDWHISLICRCNCESDFDRDSWGYLFFEGEVLSMEPLWLAWSPRLVGVNSTYQGFSQVRCMSEQEKEESRKGVAMLGTIALDQFAVSSSPSLDSDMK